LAHLQPHAQSRIHFERGDSQPTLIWTDTWLKFDGKWQIIAVPDMKDPKS
jgi:hypothetical protein